jgi:hypothetical protein
MTQVQTHDQGLGDNEIDLAQVLPKTEVKAH